MREFECLSQNLKHQNIMILVSIPVKRFNLPTIVLSTFGVNTQIRAKLLKSIYKFNSLTDQSIVKPVFIRM